jgi:hypothetical protein
VGNRIDALPHAPNQGHDIPVADVTRQPFSQRVRGTEATGAPAWGRGGQYLSPIAGSRFGPERSRENIAGCYAGQWIVLDPFAGAGGFAMRLNRPGDMFAVGALSALAVVHFFDLNPGWVFFGAVMLGWALNEEERRRPENWADR